MKYLALALVALLLPACAVTYPGKHGDVTFEFTPTSEMFDMVGFKVSRTLGDK